ncbi:MAG: class I SAM-dependent methyltransferase, partial [Candidatus Omnitrophica bacterium]|nr:class I SAM-dependent methyltransferase [Candidatus Omnitrophota bacterium]
LLPRPALEALMGFYPLDYHSYQRPIFFIFKFLSGINLAKRKKRYSVLTGGGGAVLDVGCGDGEIIQALEVDGCFKCWGVEIKEEVVKICRNKKLNVFSGTVEAIKGYDNHFDLVIANHLIEHVQDPYQTLLKINNLLCKGGWVCGETPNFDCGERRLLKNKWAGFHIPRHLQIFTVDNLRQILVKSGFSKVVIKKSQNPGQWALSLQNIFLSYFPKTKLKNGKSWIYPFLLFPSIIIFVLERVTNRMPGIIYFEAQK